MSFRRIIVALGTPDAATAMNTAVELACAMDADLQGIFVEDVELLDLAAFPFAGEVGFPSAARRPLDVAAMERGLRAQARRLHQELAARLAGKPVKWTFEVVRGRIETGIPATAGERDLAVVALPRRTPAPAHSHRRRLPTLTVPLLLVGEFVSSAAAVTVVPPLDADARQVADAIGMLAPHYGSAPLVLLVDGDTPQWTPWQEELAELLGERAIRGRFRTLGTLTRAEFERIVRAERSRLVVVVARAPSMRDALLDVLAGPLLVLPERPHPESP